MAFAQVVETSVTNNNPSQDSNHRDDLFQSRYVTPGFEPFSYLVIKYGQICMNLARVKRRTETTRFTVTKESTKPTESFSLAGLIIFLNAVYRPEERFISYPVASFCRVRCFFFFFEVTISIPSPSTDISHLFPG